MVLRRITGQFRRTTLGARPWLHRDGIVKIDSLLWSFSSQQQLFLSASYRPIVTDPGNKNLPFIVRVSIIGIIINVFDKDTGIGCKRLDETGMRYGED